MKNKLVALLIALTFVVSGCGSSQKQSSSSNDIASETSVSDGTEEDMSELDSLGDVKVENELFDVTLTIPADYVDVNTQEELDSEVADQGYQSATLNSDGSATYVMTKSQHKEMMDGIADGIKQSLSEMIGSEDYPNITAIDSNDDFTEFTVTTKSTGLDMNESFSTMLFYMYGGMYAIFNGNTADNIHVDFVNADSSEIIDSADSSDVGSTE